MRKILAKVDDARLGRAVAGLLDGSIKVVNVQHGEQCVSARIKGTRYEYTVYIEGRRVHCSCMDFYELRVQCKHIATARVRCFGIGAQRAQGVGGDIAAALAMAFLGRHPGDTGVWPLRALRGQPGPRQRVFAGPA